MDKNLPLNFIRNEIRQFFRLKKTERLWHIPALASLCTGLPLLAGYYFHRLDYGILSCIGGLVILYMPSTKLKHRMLTLSLCSFGFIISFAIGISFSFNPYLSAATLGLFAFGVNWMVNYFRLPPPGNFFFIFLATMSSCMRADPFSIPLKTGLIALGTISACLMALIYSIYITRKNGIKEHTPSPGKGHYTNLSESAIIGSFIACSLVVGLYFKMDYPYWIPVSCLAIMQGMNVVHVGQRSFHRIAGTFAGMALAWLLLSLKMDYLSICICIMILQFIIEMLVVRHYALAVVFITPMTMFLAELNKGIAADPAVIIKARAIDITIGSLIGFAGGLLLHNRKLHHVARYQMRKARISLLRK